MSEPILEQRAWRLGRGWPLAMSDLIPAQRPLSGRVLLKLLAVAITVVTFGLGGPLGVAAFTIRRRRQWLGVLAAGYLAVWVAGAIIVSTEEAGDPSWVSGLGFGLMLVVLIATSIHLAIVVAPVSVRRIRALAALERRRQARELVARDPDQARQLGIGRPHLPHDFDDGGLIDPNEVPPGVLTRIPGVTAQHAALIVAEREQHGPFSTIEDLGRRDLFPSPLPPAVAEFLVIISVGGTRHTS